MATDFSLALQEVGIGKVRKIQFLDNFLFNMSLVLFCIYFFVIVFRNQFFVFISNFNCKCFWKDNTVCYRTILLNRCKCRIRLHPRWSLHLLQFRGRYNTLRPHKKHDFFSFVETARDFRWKLLSFRSFCNINCIYTTSGSTRCERATSNFLV